MYSGVSFQKLHQQVTTLVLLLSATVIMYEASIEDLSFLKSLSTSPLSLQAKWYVFNLYDWRTRRSCCGVPYTRLTSNLARFVSTSWQVASGLILCSVISRLITEHGVILGDQGCWCLMRRRTFSTCIVKTPAIPPRSEWQTEATYKHCQCSEWLKIEDNYTISGLNWRAYSSVLSRSGLSFNPL